MSNIQALLDPEVKERPAHVKFERRAVEDKAASLREGKYVAMDVDFVTVTAVGNGGNGVIFKVPQWFKNLDYEVDTQRIPPSWRENYKRMYEMWRNGQEVTVDGTPIRGWLALSPAIQENIIRAGVHTVEDLAAANAEAIQRIGMGGLEAKHKAAAHLKALGGTGQLVQENAALRAQMTVLEASNQSLLQKVEELAAMVKAQQDRPTDKQPVDYETEVTFPVKTAKK